MIDLNTILEDFSNITESDEALKILDSKIYGAFETINSCCLELYSDSYSLKNFILFFFMKSIEDFVEFYQISVEDIDYGEEGEDIE